MRATVMYGAGDVRVEDVPDARLVEPTDALVRVTRAAICGSDLWPYKSMPHDEQAAGWDTSSSASSTPSAPTSRPSSLATSSSRRSSGRTAAASSAARDCTRIACTAAGTAPRCRRRPGRSGACPAGGRHPGRPAGGEDDALMPSLLALTDVMGTGHHAALTARSAPARPSPSSATGQSGCAA